MSEAATVMSYKFTGDVTGATAALQELKARLADVNRDSSRFAKEAVKGNQEARKSLLENVQASDQLKSKIRELTTATQNFQKAGGEAGKTFMGLSKGQVSGAFTSIAFGLDDAMQQFAATGKASDAVRAAGNNLTMLASFFGPVAVVATAAATSVAMFWTKASERNDDSLKKLEAYKKGLEDLKGAEARGRGDVPDEAKLKAARGVAWQADQKEAEAAKALKETEEAQGGAAIFRLGEAFSGGLPARKEEYLAAKEDARKAREGLKQMEKEDAEKRAAQTFAPMKGEFAEAYKAALATTGTQDAAKAAVFQKAKGMAANETEAMGLERFIGGIATETDADLRGKGLAKQFRDEREPELFRREARARDMRAERNQLESQFEEQRLGENRKSFTKDQKAEIAKRDHEIKLMEEQNKLLSEILKSNQKQVDEKAAKIIMPKGIGEAGR